MHVVQEKRVRMYPSTYRLRDVRLVPVAQPRGGHTSPYDDVECQSVKTRKNRVVIFEVSSKFNIFRKLLAKF